MNKLTTYPLGKVGANWLQTLNKLSICLPGKTPSAPSEIPSVLEEQPILGRDTLRVEDEHDVLSRRLEEHKICQEEVCSRWNSKLGYQRARRTKPYQTARKTCCGGRGVESEEAVAFESSDNSCSGDSSSSKPRVNRFHHLEPNRELRHALQRAGVKLDDRSASECSSDECSSSGGNTP